jgi:hypothetical protein
MTFDVRTPNPRPRDIARFDCEVLAQAAPALRWQATTGAVIMPEVASRAKSN